MTLSDGTILVTGAGGFIGSHLVEALVARNCAVRAMVQYNSRGTWGWLDAFPDDLKKRIDIFRGDIRDPNGVRTAMRGCDTVMHLAALIAIPYSYHSPDAYIDTNIKGTLNILQAARDLGVRKVVHTSTSEVYGTARFVPITETHPLQGQSPYSASKIGADQLAMSFYSSFETPVAIIRPFNTYGPRQSARAVLPTIIMQVASGRRVLDLGAITPTRDFNYVSDTVGGFIAVAASDMSVGEVINIGSNFEISIGDAAHLVGELMGVDLTIRTDDERIRPEKSEVARLWADNSLARKLLGWTPEFAGREGLKRGLACTIDWFSRSENLARYKSGQYNL
jgi:NAD dependent epimerase/dehydratase